MKRGLVVLSVIAFTALAGLLITGPGSSSSGITCYGVERWPIKTLSDSQAGQVRLTPKPSFVAMLWPLGPPAHFDQSQRVSPVETTVYRITAKLVKARWVNDPPPSPGKRGGDLDFHLVVQDLNDPSKTMIVEFPDPPCVHAVSKLKRKMTAARKAFIKDCGQPQTAFQNLTGSATITGVGFFDRPHADGHALHGIELHPALSFKSSNCHFS